jgi:hypothetical protein
MEHTRQLPNLQATTVHGGGDDAVHRALASMLCTRSLHLGGRCISGHWAPCHHRPSTSPHEPSQLCQAVRRQVKGAEGGHLLVGVLQAHLVRRVPGPGQACALQAGQQESMYALQLCKRTQAH